MSRNDSRAACWAESEGIDGCIAVLAYLDDTIVGVPAELAGIALPLAVATFSRSGHTVHPGKSACWSHSADSATLPEDCQRIWSSEGLKVGGIPVFNASREPVLAQEMLRKRLSRIEQEAEFLSSIVFDDQNAAAESWCRVQSIVLLLRYSLAAKLVYFGQTIDPAILQPFARRFDDIVLNTFLKVLEIDDISEAEKLQVQLALREGGCGMRSHDMKVLHPAPFCFLGFACRAGGLRRDGRTHRQRRTGRRRGGNLRISPCKFHS